MREYYIGDFYNPEEAKESWENYVKRKKREEGNNLKGWQQALLFAVYALIFVGLFYYLKSTPLPSEIKTPL
jgi:hypothetical protein